MFSFFCSDSPQYGKNLTFTNFTCGTGETCGCITNNRGGDFILETNDKLSGLTFSNANNKAYFLNVMNTGARSVQLLDTDGSITGLTPGGWLVSNATSDYVKGSANFHIPSGVTCTAKTDWRSYLCPLFAQGYGQIHLSNTNYASTSYLGTDGVDHKSELYSTHEDDTLIRAAYYPLGSSTTYFELTGNKRSSVSQQSTINNKNKQTNNKTTIE